MATPRRAQNATSSATPAEKVEVQETPTPEDAERIGTLDSVMGGSEVIVGAVEDVIPQHIREQMDLVTIRVNENIEQMSIVAGGRRFSARFEEGHMYRVPPDVAEELERIGKVYH